MPYNPENDTILKGEEKAYIDKMLGMNDGSIGTALNKAEARNDARDEARDKLQQTVDKEAAKRTVENQKRPTADVWAEYERQKAARAAKKKK